MFSVKIKFLFLVVFLFIPILSAFSQSENPVWMEYLDELTEDDEADLSTLENLFDQLSYLSQHPFNIQTITKQELEQLPFLSDAQIEGILYYVYKYGPLVKLYELKNIPELEPQTIRYLLPFVYLGKPEKENNTLSAKDLLKSGKHDLLLRTDHTLQEKAGYRSGYLGEPYYMSFRYNYQYKEQIQFGITGEKDPGEVFLSPEVKGFDHYSFSLKMKDIIRLKELYLGDYRLSFGEGLALNNHFGIGKASDAVNINRKGQGIKRHVSTNEVDFFRGLAGLVDIDPIRFTFFYSFRELDARVEGNRIYSFKTDGYHRTYNDLQKKNAVGINLLGSHLDWKSSSSLQLGFTFVYYSFGDKMLNPDIRPYNKYYLRAKNHFNTSVDYRYQKRKIRFQGEFAMDAAGKIAFLNHCLWKPRSDMDISLSVRYYDQAYNALYARSFSESSGVRNEKGFYAGIKWQPIHRVEVSGYWDYFKFPWIKYGINAPSSGNDRLIQITYYSNNDWRMSLRYRYREKSKNTKLDEDDITYVLPYEQHRMRYRLDYQYNSSLAFQLQAHYNQYKSKNKNAKGWSLTQSLSYTPPSTRFRFDTSIAYFDASDWDTHISIYEKNVLYAFYFPSYYGKGWRMYLNLKWTITPVLTLYGKIANTHYLDRNKIGSGLEEIEGTDKTDLSFLIRYKF